MTATISIRELARNTNILQEYDYVDVEDKKSHEYKGMFVSPKYADELKLIIEKKISDQKQESLDELMQFAGAIGIDKTFMDMSSKELRHARAGKNIE